MPERGDAFSFFYRTLRRTSLSPSVELGGVVIALKYDEIIALLLATSCETISSLLPDFKHSPNSGAHTLRYLVNPNHTVKRQVESQTAST